MRAPAARRLVRAVLGALLLLLPQACGDKEKGYCAAMSADQKLFAEMQDDPTGLGLLAHRSTLHDLGDRAPDDLRDEWQTFLGALDAFAKTLDQAGVQPGAFVDGRPPADLSAAERTRIAHAASELAAPDVVEAADGIEQQAKDVCKLQLGL
jgi:hypothetical protein